ncbi:glycosyltransferase family 87 protein [uncultured Sphingomonas sp.]|uniref:glycosyltransferase family 87 protein n=1 Tax=uncultured Sphingomonas sp. TaxID=158754 RepID=UPI0025E9B75D|nr:glycosyltransferase family 87 protein [uncultured Sphingomonas sp.]
MQALTDPKLRLAVLLLVAIAVRSLAFGNPLVHVDEDFYFVAASKMLDGALPFVDLWDRKPLGLFLVYAPAAALPFPLGIWTYQAMALACVVATAMIVARFATRAGWANGATAAGIAYILWLNMMGGVGGQSPVFYNLLMAIAAWLTATTQGPRRRWRGLGAMALVGLAMQVKYSVVFEGMMFGLWLLAGEWRARRSVSALVGYGAALVALAVLPTAAAFAYYAAIGHADAFVYANFTSITLRKPDPWPYPLTAALELLLILSPLIAMTGGSSRVRAATGEPQVRTFVHVWLATALTGIAVFGGYYEHYGLPAALPGAIGAAGFLGAGHWRGRATPAILILATLAALGTPAVNRYRRGDGAQLARLTDAIGRGPGCLYIYSGPAMPYRVSQRCTVTPYLFPSHMQHGRETGAIGIDQATELRRIFATKPAVVINQPLYSGERENIHFLYENLIARDYRLKTMTPIGDHGIEVWIRR